MKSSVSYSHQITVNKSLKEAWAVTLDESKYAQWLDGFKSITLISGEKGAVGSTYKVVVNPGEGQSDFEMIETVVSVKEFERVELHFSSEPMDFEQIISFKENGGRTTLKNRQQSNGKEYHDSCHVCAHGDDHRFFYGPRDQER